MSGQNQFRLKFEVAPAETETVLKFAQRTLLGGLKWSSQCMYLFIFWEQSSVVNFENCRTLYQPVSRGKTSNSVNPAKHFLRAPFTDCYTFYYENIELLVVIIIFEWILPTDFYMAKCQFWHFYGPYPKRGQMDQNVDLKNRPIRAPKYCFKSLKCALSGSVTCWTYVNVHGAWGGGGTGVGSGPMWTGRGWGEGQKPVLWTS